MPPCDSFSLGKKLVGWLLGWRGGWGSRNSRCFGASSIHDFCLHDISCLHDGVSCISCWKVFFKLEDLLPLAPTCGTFTSWMNFVNVQRIQTNDI